MRMKSIVEFMSEGCLSCRGNSINLWNEMEKWIELTNRQRVNEWAAVNGNEQAPPTQAPNARGKPIQLQSIILCEDDWWNWFGGVEWVVFVGGYRRLQAAGNQPTKETSLPLNSLSSFQSTFFSWRLSKGKRVEGYGAEPICASQLNSIKSLNLIPLIVFCFDWWN